MAKKKPPSLRRVRAEPPRNENGGFDKEKIEEMFFQSDTLSWTQFCYSQGWDPFALRGKLPSGSWVKKKKKLVWAEHAEAFESFSFDHIQVWKRDVLYTMRYYPKAIDKLKDITDIAINDLIRDYNAQSGKKKKIDSVRLERLSRTVIMLQEAKYRSLLIDNITIQNAQDPDGFDEETKKNKLSGKTQQQIEKDEVNERFTFEIAGSENMTKDQLEDFMREQREKYMDPPQFQDAEFEEIEPNGEEQSRED